MNDASDLIKDGILDKAEDALTEVAKRFEVFNGEPIDLGDIMERLEALRPNRWIVDPADLEVDDTD